MNAILEENSEEMIALEALVDRVGMRNVLFALEHIAWAKAEHVEHTWQDHDIAKVWRSNAWPAPGLDDTRLS